MKTKVLLFLAFLSVSCSNMEGPCVNEIDCSPQCNQVLTKATGESLSILGDWDISTGRPVDYQAKDSSLDSLYDAIQEMYLSILQDAMGDPDIKSVTFLSPVIESETTSKKQPVSLLPSSSEESSFPSGLLNSGSECRFFAPYGMLGVNCHCMSPAFGALHFVTTNFFGSSTTGTRTGSGSLYVPIAASNTNGSIAYRTTDSNEAYCSWSGTSSSM